MDDVDDFCSEISLLSSMEVSGVYKVQNTELYSPNMHTAMNTDHYYPLQRDNTGLYMLSF